MAETICTTARAGPEHRGQRLDRVLSDLFPGYSRARLQAWVRDGSITVDGGQVKPSHRLHGGEAIAVDVEVTPESEVTAQPIPLSIVHEDEAVIVIDKPAGLVVHPAAGNRDGTLQNALLHHDPALAAIPRAGIVHRLDKLTSGVMVVARTLKTHASLVAQLQARTMRREYRALVYGAMVAGGTIDAPIGRHPSDRVRMAVVASGKPAISHYRIADRYRDFTWLAVTLESGRTHQIRVHMAHAGHPVVGDPVYGGRLKIPAGTGDQLEAALRGLRRQALHAMHLSFEHPQLGDVVSYTAPLPDDLQQLLEALNDDSVQRDPR